MARKKATAESPQEIVQQTDAMQTPQEQIPAANGNQPSAREPGDDSHLNGRARIGS